MQFVETENLIIRKVCTSDFDDYFRDYLMDKEMDRLMCRCAIETEEELLQGFDWFLNKEERAYVIVHKDSGIVIGVLSVYNKVPDFVAQQPQVQGKQGKSLSFSLSKQWRRKGYMKEAVSAVIKVLFEVENTDYINCGYLSFNEASACFQKALGFSYLTTEHFEMDGQHVTSIENILTKELWEHAMIFQIRRVSKEDAVTLATIQTASWKAAFRDILSPEDLDKCTELSRAINMYTRLLETGKGNGYIGEVNGTPHCIAWWDKARDPGMPEYAEIICIHSLPNNWRKGYGGQMMDRLFRDIRESGFQKVMLWVFTDNHRARAFYEAKGFAAMSSVKPAMGTTEMCYMKELK